jgi:cell division septation protein DedD
MPWLTFWLAVAGVCLVIAYVSFRIGRDVIGVKLAESGGPVRELQSGSLSDRGTPGWAAGVAGTFETRAPLQPIVEIEPLDDIYGSRDASAEGEPEGTEEPPEEPIEAADESDADEPMADTEADAAAVAEEEVSLDDEAEVVPAPTERTRGSATSGGRFGVRVGSYTDEDVLFGQMTRLRGLGYRPWVEEHLQDGTTYKRLFAAETATYEGAVRVQDELQGQGISSLVVEE